MILTFSEPLDALPFLQTLCLNSVKPMVVVVVGSSMSIVRSLFASLGDGNMTYDVDRVRYYDCGVEILGYWAPTERICGRRPDAVVLLDEEGIEQELREICYMSDRSSVFPGGQS